MGIDVFFSLSLAFFSPMKVRFFPTPSQAILQNFFKSHLLPFRKKVTGSGVLEKKEEKKKSTCKVNKPKMDQKRLFDGHT